MSVSTNPGATVATAMPCGARALASDWPKAFRPALLAPYAGWPGSPRKAPREDTLTMRPADFPEPWRIMCWTAHQVTLAAPTRLTPSVSCQAACHCAYDISVIGCGVKTPALFTRT